MPEIALDTADLFEDLSHPDGDQVSHRSRLTDSNVVVIDATRPSSSMLNARRQDGDSSRHSDESDTSRRRAARANWHRMVSRLAQGPRSGLSGVRPTDSDIGESTRRRRRPAIIVRRQRASTGMSTQTQTTPLPLLSLSRPLRTFVSSSQVSLQVAETTSDESGDDNGYNTDSSVESKHDSVFGGDSCDDKVHTGEEFHTGPAERTAACDAADVDDTRSLWSVSSDASLCRDLSSDEDEAESGHDSDTRGVRVEPGRLPSAWGDI
ncbi:MAG: hypothetical protein MHM6MM_007626 [Cercozoa sp. M6MM]